MLEPGQSDQLWEGPAWELELNVIFTGYLLCAKEATDLEQI